MIDCPICPYSSLHHWNPTKVAHDVCRGARSVGLGATLPWETILAMPAADLHHKKIVKQLIVISAPIPPSIVVGIQKNRAICVSPMMCGGGAQSWFGCQPPMGDNLSNPCC